MLEYTPSSMYVIKGSLHLIYTNGFLRISTAFIDVEESTKRIVLKFH